MEYLREEDRFIAEGNVKITRGTFELTAERASLNKVTRRLTAEGKVGLKEGGSRLTAESVEYDLDTGEGTLEEATLFFEEGHISIKAKQIVKQAGGRYRLKEATLTTCDFSEDETPLWRFRVKDARMRVDGYLAARKLTFDIKGIPVFYLPYLLMPVKTTRQTGLLVPRMGYHSRDGLRFNEDFFWAITNNQDATFSLDYRGSGGVGGGLEYRYQLNRLSGGEALFRLFDDRSADRQRWEGQWRHTQAFSRDFQARINLHLINDIDQFRDLSEVTEERLRNTLESSVSIFHRWDNHYLYLSGHYLKDLIEPDPSVSEKGAVQRLPEIGYRLLPYSIFGLPLYLGMEATATRFWVEEEDVDLGLIRSQRVDFFPQITGRIDFFGAVITPRAGWRGTWYSEGLNEDGPVQRSVGVFDVDGSLRLNKLWMESPDGMLRRLVHHVKTGVVYEYVPDGEQGDLPQYDAIDQLPTKNLATASFTNRLTGLIKGGEMVAPVRREILMVRFTQSYDVREKRMEEAGRRTRPYSNVRGEMTLRPFSETWIDLDGFYNVYDHRAVSIGSDLTTRPFPYFYVSAGQRFTRRGTSLPIGDVLNPLSQSDELFWYSSVDSPLIRFYSGTARLDSPFGLSLATRLYYDAVADKFAEVDYGFQYDGGCWAMAVSYIDLPGENQVNFLFTLKTAGSTDSRAFLDLVVSSKQ